MTRIKELQGAWAEFIFIPTYFSCHTIYACTLKKETGVARRYMLALSPESSELTKAGADTRAGLADHDSRPGDLFPLFSL